MFSPSHTKRVKTKLIPNTHQAAAGSNRNNIGIIMLYGDESRCKEVAISFSKQNMRTKYYSDIDKMALSVSHNTTAAVFVEPIVDATTAMAVKEFKKIALTEKFALFAIASNDKTADSTRELYRLGVRDVFKWTVKTGLMPKLVKQHLKTAKMGRGLTPQDRRLSRAVMNRLKFICGAGLDVSISVRNGKANIIGRIKTLQKKNKIEDIIFSTPGITDVVTKSVVVPITRKLDRDLSKSIHSRLQSNPSIKEGSLSIEVNNAIVTVAGTTCDKYDAKRILKLIGSVDQVRSINNLMLVSKEQAEKDNTLAEKAKNLISRFFIHSNINVSIIRNTAFLTGKVDLEDKKIFASSLLKQNLNRVENIVNKITIV